MRRLLIAALVILGAALSVPAVSQTQKVLSSPVQSTAPVTIGTFTIAISQGFGYKTIPVNISGMRSGKLIVQVNGTLQADSVKVDSTAMEIHAFTAPTWSSSADASDIEDSDDSNVKHDGWFVTAMDSATLVLPQMLTPWSGGNSIASTTPRFPSTTPSRVFHLDRSRTTNEGAAVPGSAFISYGPLLRSVSIPMSGPFGDQLFNARSLQFRVLWRHPRVDGLTVTLKWVGSSY